LKTYVFVIQLFVSAKLSDAVPREGISNAMVDYAKRAVQLTWLMNVHVPPFVLTWQEPHEEVKRDKFELYRKGGRRIVTTVWPAVLTYEGKVKRKGVVMSSG